MLLGNLDPDNTDGGNMKKNQFYICTTYGNIITSTDEAELSCSGRKLTALIPKSCDRVLFVKLYPEQSNEVRFPKMYGGKIYFSYNQHGLWVNEG